MREDGPAERSDEALLDDIEHCDDSITIERMHGQWTISAGPGPDSHWGRTLREALDIFLDAEDESKFGEDPS